MEKMNFEIIIDAPVEKVYKIMLEDRTYREWTSEFNPTSSFEGDWSKGSKMRFLGTDSNGEVGGMVSRIEENVPNQFVSIKHLGLLKGKEEITSGPEVEMWAGGLENYTFVANGDQTVLKVECDTTEEFKSYFLDTWPRALNKLKSICEK